MSFQFISIDIHLTDISITFMNPNKRPPPPRHPDEYPLAEQPHKKIKTNSGSQTSGPGSYRGRWPEVYFPMLEGVLLKLSVNVKELDLSSDVGKQVNRNWGGWAFSNSWTTHGLRSSTWV